MHSLYSHSNGSVKDGLGLHILQPLYAEKQTTRKTTAGYDKFLPSLSPNIHATDVSNATAMAALSQALKCTHLSTSREQPKLYFKNKLTSKGNSITLTQIPANSSGTLSFLAHTHTNTAATRQQTICLPDQKHVSPCTN